MRRYKLFPILIISAFFILGGFYRLTDLQTLSFDEGYYIPAAKKYIDKDIFANAEHPPLGKILLMAGIMSFGDNPVGWRIAPLTFGTIGVILLYFFALEIFKDKKTALFSAFLLATDTLWTYFSTLATLDIFVSVMLIVSAWRLWSFLEKPDIKNAVLLGVVLGLASAVKWSAVFFLLAAFIIVIIWRNLISGVGYSAKSFILFIASYITGYFLPFIFFWGSVDLARIALLQVQALFVHTSARNVFDSNAVPPWLWFFQKQLSDKHYSTNPLLFFVWPFVFILKVFEIIKGAGRKVDLKLVFVLVCFCSLYFPWFFVQRPTYTFYILPALPFICLVTGSVLKDIWEGKRWGRDVVAVYLLVSVFVYFYTFS
ncbi:MAG: Glycosyl transferase family 39 [Microgenomates group bacterium GW2011_GWF1_38_5]|nr:MAG: Glycosyl transferase family 39 [Microgenomates group bacterium GW2011_GWF1_38_5]